MGECVVLSGGVGDGVYGLVMGGSVMERYWFLVPWVRGSCWSVVNGVAGVEGAVAARGLFA